MRRTALLVLPALAALSLSATARAADPLAVTGAAKNLSATSATLVATVNPGGEATSVRFDVGTTTGYGLQSSAKDIGSGTAPVTVEIPIEGLAASTTYHVRAVATNTDGTAHGGDQTFTTPEPPESVSAPSVVTGEVRATTPFGTTVTGTVDPNGAPTTYHVVYGTTTNYDATTAPVDVGAGTRPRSVAVPIAGLQPFTTYHYRLVATNVRATRRGSDRTFKTGRIATSVTLSADVVRVPYGDPVTVRGKVGGSLTSGVAVRLQLTPFPFSTPFADVLTPGRSSGSGSFSFKIPSITQTTRASVIADGRLLSPVVTIYSSVRVGILSVGRQGATVVVRGRVRPFTPNGTVSVQRRGASGRWVPLARAGIRAGGLYRALIPASRRAAPIRVVGLALDGGAHVSGTSREVLIGAYRR